MTIDITTAATNSATTAAITSESVLVTTDTSDVRTILSDVTTIPNYNTISYDVTTTGGYDFTSNDSPHDPYEMNVSDLCPDLCIPEGYTEGSIIPPQTEKQAQEIKMAVKKMLKVEPKKTSSYYRKLTSAQDWRTSSTSVGIGGIVILISAICVIVLSDMASVFFGNNNRFGLY